MHRAKQHAFAFLFGAVVVGGVVDQSAATLVAHTRQAADQARRIDRGSFFDDLGLTPEQRSAWTRIADSTNCRVLQLNAPLKTRLDSVRDWSRSRLVAVLTPDQLDRLTARAREDSLQRASARPPGSPPDHNPCDAR